MIAAINKQETDKKVSCYIFVHFVDYVYISANVKMAMIKLLVVTFIGIISIVPV